MLTPTVPIGSTNRLFYRGPIGVAGVSIQQTLDVSDMPLAIRQDKTFSDNWILFIRPIDPGISAFSTDVDFTNGPDGFPANMVFTLTAAAPTDNVDIEAWYITSGTR